MFVSHHTAVKIKFKDQELTQTVDVKDQNPNH